MDFKNKLFSKLPFTYILHKTKDKKRAKQIYKAYKTIKREKLFDENSYHEKYPETSSMDGLLHYFFFGFEEGKNPGKEFDDIFYENEYGVDVNPLIHYALIGKNKGYRTKIEKKELKDFKDTSKTAILFVLHERLSSFGGAGFTSLDIVKSLDNSYQKFILTSADGKLELFEYESKLKKIAEWNIEDELPAIYEEILSKLAIDIIHINHLINHNFDIIDIANKLNIKFIISIHDFYYCCPSIHLINDNTFCNLNCKNCKRAEFIDKWQKQCEKILKEAHTIIFPSKSTLEIYQKFYTDLDNYKIIEHGRNIEKTNTKPTFPKDKIKILFPGNISPHKGSLLIDSIKKIDNNRLEFHFMGITNPKLGCGINHGKYKRKEFGKIADEIKPNYIGIMSTCPETYSHTLTESIASNIPIIATDLGAQKERVERDDIGWIVNHENPEDIYNTIVNIKEEDYNRKVENISKLKPKTFNEMINEYKKIYSDIKWK